VLPLSLVDQRGVELLNWAEKQKFGTALYPLMAKLLLSRQFGEKWGTSQATTAFAGSNQNPGPNRQSVTVLGRYLWRYSGNCIEHLRNNSPKKGASARRDSCMPSYEPSLKT